MIGLQERSGRLYGRKWEIIIYKPAYVKDGELLKRDPENDIAIDVSLLRCIFKTEQKSIMTQNATCTLIVYNMNIDTEKSIIKEGFQISIKGGYQEGQYGEVFTGDVVQVIRNRENGVDYRLEIIALKGSGIFDLNHIKSSIAAKSEPRKIADTIAKQSQIPFAVGEVSDNLSNQQLPRGKVLFGTPSKYLRDLAIGNDAYYWAGEDNKLTIKKFNDEIPVDQMLVLTPDTGLVGTPQYTNDGIIIKMLLDCRVKLFSYIKIDNELIRKQLISLNLDGAGNNQLAQQHQFDQDGEYQVSSLAHYGDTYGDDWFTEVTGVGRNGKVPLAQENKSQTQR